MSFYIFYNRIDEIKENVKDITNEKEVTKYLERVVARKAGDGSGLIYGLGHANYTLSDPRGELLHNKAKALAREQKREDELHLLELIEKRGISKNKLSQKGELERTQINNYCKNKINNLIFQLISIIF